MLFSESRNDLRPHGRRLPQGSRQRLRDRDNAAGIGNNSAEIDDNSADICDGAAGIVDIAANVIPC